MRIAISGDGEAAYELASRLSAQHDVIVLEEDPDRAARFERLDVQVVAGHPTHPETLRNAGLDRSSLFIACRRSDELNIISSLTARHLAACRTFCFVSKREYYDALTPTDGVPAVLEIDRVIWPQRMLAEEIARLVLVPSAIDVEIFAGGRIWLLEYRLADDSPLLGGPLPALGLPKGVLAVAVVRGDHLRIPTGETSFAPGDRVIFMGEQRPLHRLHGRIMGVESRGVREITIIGGGTVGHALAGLLGGEKDLRVRIIESSRERCVDLTESLRHTMVLNGDGTDLRLLEAELIHRSHVLVSVTSNDEQNLLCSLLARQMEIPKIVTRVNRAENLALFRGMGIDVPLNPRTTAIQMILNSIEGTSVKQLSTIEGGKGSVLEIFVPDDFPARALKDIPRVHDSIVVALTESDRTRVPHGDDVVRPGNRLLVFCTADASREVLRAWA